MPVPDEALRRYKRQIGIYRDRTSGLLIAAWDALPSHDEEDVDEFVRRTAPALVGAKRAAVALSAGFFALALRIRPVGVSPDDVDLEPDIQGPFRATWHALAMGRPIAEALTVGRSTAQAVGFDFVQSTARRTGDVVAAASGRTVRWRRVPGAKSCDWCRLVAGQTYKTAESADFGHERDDCDVVPA
jgi:hypothetical protein